jgi:hypothetical protein
MAITGSSNFFFNNFGSFQEQQLLESLTIEAISIYGHDCFYIPRNLRNYDQLYGNDDQSDYSTNYMIAMYIKSYDGFKGNGNFLSKFGLEIRSQVVFSVAQKIFNDEIGNVRGQLRPNEGDLIYFPLNGKCFQVTYVEKLEFFYQLGKVYTWDMTCELFEYSNEKFNTGIPEIDVLQARMNTDTLNTGIKNEAGAYLLTESSDFLILEGTSSTDVLPNDDSLQIQTESDRFIDFTIIDPFSEGYV